ncbi:unnamed protein product [Mytilus edulis]|uniref:Uncharacterized protein n=1 Tax=Mytilus edulis TaxID=6550 RepID=A0A8S3UB38_MYTED|nr:unnamed protein product [Mytilus edulis]
MDLTISKKQKTQHLLTIITLETSDPETRITPVSSDATLRETGISPGNLDTMIRLEETDLGNQKLPQTIGTPETTNQKGRRSSDATTDIYENENPTSNIVAPTSPNSSILMDSSVPGPSFAFEMNQYDSVKTTDCPEEKQPSLVILSPETAGRCNVLKRRHIPRNVDQEHKESPINTQIAQENDEWKKEPHFERRRMFHLAKHIVSIVLFILDLVFDWVEYSEMNKTGNYTIAADRSVNNVELTIECEGIGKTIQFIC